MCGQRLKRFSRNIGVILLLLLVGSQVFSSPLDELEQILGSYEQIYENLQGNINSLSSRLTDLESSHNRQVTLSKDLERNLSSIQLGLPKLEETLSKSRATLTILETQIKGYESGYRNMEKQLKIYKGVVIVSVGISVASLAFVLFKTLL